jgi:glutathione S-transferase
LKLLYQTHSPFARKVLVFAHEAGLADRLLVEPHETSPTRSNDAVFALNPLGKVPVLERADGPPIFDSDVICAYLDTLNEGEKLIPAEGERRWRGLQMQAIAQGMADAGIAVRWESERRPPAFRFAPLRAGYEHKLHMAYRWLDRALEVRERLHVGHIALATTLDWLLFRDLPSFRDHAILWRWFVDMTERPSMRATPLHGETRD